MCCGAGPVVSTAEGSGRGGSVYSVCPSQRRPEPVDSGEAQRGVVELRAVSGQRSAGMSEQMFARGRCNGSFLQNTWLGWHHDDLVVKGWLLTQHPFWPPQLESGLYNHCLFSTAASRVATGHRRAGL